MTVIDADGSGVEPLVVDPRLEPPPFFLVDGVSVNRGRTTPLRVGERVRVGTKPSATAPSDLILIVDDLRVREQVFDLLLSDDERVLLVPETHSIVLVNGTRATAEVAVSPGSTIELPVYGQGAGAGSAPLRSVSFSVTTAEGLEARNPFGQVRFEQSARAPRETYGRLAKDTLPRRPEEGPPPRFRVEQILVPLVLGAIVAILMSPAFLIFLVAQPIVYVYGYIQDRREARKRYASDLTRWEDECDRAITELGGLVERERRLRLNEAPSTASILPRARRRLPDLWERRVSDQDFLQVRLGTGDTFSGYRDQFRYQDASSDTKAQAAIARKVITSTYLAGIPVTVNLVEHNVAVVGPWRSVFELCNGLIMQLMCLQSPASLVVAALLPKDGTLLEPLSWLKWLPALPSCFDVVAGRALCSRTAAS